ncbi:MAG: LysM peptidoglycan-binding domain-containing protein [Bdellovibrionales bacterium]
MVILGLVSALAFEMSVKASAFDPPDLRLEAEFHRQYLRQKQVKQGLTPVQEGYIESYRIQNGDTLWSLSETLYGDGQFWPRVWSQNHAISNPHLIRPGHSVQFLLGSEDDTPSFRISEAGEAGLELAASTNANPLIDIPPPEIPPRPVLKVPGSFPEWQQVYKQLPVQVTDDSGLLKQRNPPLGKAYLTAFVQEERLVASGKFLEPDLESSLPMENQYVFVKVKRGIGQPGMKMLIVWDAGVLRRLNKTIEKIRDVHLIQISGEIELSEPMPAVDEEYDIFRALITKAVGLSTKDYSVIPGELQEISLAVSGASAPVDAEVIGAAKNEGSSIYGPGEIVFIDRGSGQGVEVGQILDIYVNRKFRKDTLVEFSPASSGKIRIVKVTPNYATAVLLEATDSIQQGDKVQQANSRRASREVLELGKDDWQGPTVDEKDIEKDLGSSGWDDSDVGGSEFDSEDEF